MFEMSFLAPFLCHVLVFVVMSNESMLMVVFSIVCAAAYVRP